MKKRTIFISCFIILIGLVGVGVSLYVNRDNQKVTPDTAQNTSNETSKKDVRQAVWEQLSDKQQEHIIWQDGTLSKTTLAKGSTFSDGEKIVKVEEYAGKEVYTIDFPTDSMAVPNNMIVYADTDTNTIIGYGLVD